MHFPHDKILILFAVKAYCRDVSLTAILLKWRFNFVTGPTEVGKRGAEGALVPLTSFQKLLPVFPKRCPFYSKKLPKMSTFLNFLTNFAPPVLNISVNSAVNYSAGKGWIVNSLSNYWWRQIILFKQNFFYVTFCATDISKFIIFLYHLIPYIFLWN